jgi:hypothetical protein
VVVGASTPRSISPATASAVNALDPLAMPKSVSTVFGIPYARWASPYARRNSTSPPWSTETTPEKSCCATNSSMRPIAPS